MKPFIPCGKCENGYVYGRLGIQECACRVKWRQVCEMEIKIEKAQIPLSAMDYDISKYQGMQSVDSIELLKKYTNNFDKMNRVNLYLWSRANSTQKTTVALWIGTHLLEQGYSVQFVLMNDLLKELVRADFEDSSREYIQKLIECDFLIIDDSFDPKKVTVYKSGYQIAFLDSFLRKRLTSHATCFTANISISEIGSTFEMSLQKLIERSIVNPMEFKDEINGALLNREAIMNMWESL